MVEHGGRKTATALGAETHILCSFRLKQCHKSATRIASAHQQCASQTIGIAIVKRGILTFDGIFCERIETTLMQRQTYIKSMHPSGLNQLLSQRIFLPGLCDDATEVVLFFLFCHPRCPKNKARRGQKGQTREGPFAIQPEDIRGIRAPIVALTTGNGFYLYI